MDCLTVENREQRNSCTINHNFANFPEVYR
jgi:hypothetical protein